MTEPRRFDFRELAGADDSTGDADLGAAFAAARTLESALTGPDPRPSADLADRIMAAVAREPVPRALGILAALRRRPGLTGLVESLRVAWGRAFGRTGSPALRLGGLAYVVAIVVLAISISGVATYTTAGALGLLAPARSPVASTAPILPTNSPVASPEPSERQSARPSETPEPSETPDPTDATAPGGDQGAASDPGEVEASPPSEPASSERPASEGN